MEIGKHIRNFLKRLGRMGREGRSEEVGRGKFGRKGLLSGVYEYLVRIGVKKTQGDEKWTETKGNKS